MRLFSVTTTNGKVHWFGAGYKARRFIIDTNKEAKKEEKIAKDVPWNEEENEHTIVYADKDITTHIIPPGKDSIVDLLNKR